MTFHEEFLALLKRHRVEYDPRYLWEWTSAVPSGLERIPLPGTQGWNLGL